jgi:hypothetical protein
MTPILTLGSEVRDIIPILALTGGFATFIVMMVMRTIRRTVEIKAREESRREIAAYVAEGSMSADDAYKLMKEGSPKGSGCC